MQERTLSKKNVRKNTLVHTRHVTFKHVELSTNISFCHLSNYRTWGINYWRFFFVEEDCRSTYHEETQKGLRTNDGSTKNKVDKL